MARRKNERAEHSAELNEQLSVEVLDASLQFLQGELGRGNNKIRPEVLVGQSIGGEVFDLASARATFDKLIARGDISKRGGRKGKYWLNDAKTVASERARETNEQIEGVQDKLVREKIDTLVESYESSFEGALNDEERKADIAATEEVIQQFEKGQDAYAIPDHLKGEALDRLRALKTSFETQLSTAEKEVVTKENEDEEISEVIEMTPAGMEAFQQMQADQEKMMAGVEARNLAEDEVREEFLSENFENDEAEEDAEVIDLTPEGLEERMRMVRERAVEARNLESDLDGFEDEDTEELLKDPESLNVNEFGVPVDQDVVRSAVIDQIEAQQKKYIERYEAGDTEKRARMVEKSEFRKKQFEDALADESSELRQQMTEAEIEKTLFYIDSFLRKANQEQIVSQTEGFVDKGFEETDIRQEKIDEYNEIVAKIQTDYEAGDDAEKARLRAMVSALDNDFRILADKPNDPKRLEISLAEIALIGAAFQGLEDRLLGLSPEEVERLQSDEKEIGDLPTDLRKEPALGLPINSSGEKKTGEPIDPGSIEIPDRNTDEKELKKQIESRKAEEKDTESSAEKLSKVELAKAIAKGLGTAAASMTGTRLLWRTFAHFGWRRGTANKDLDTLNYVLNSKEKETKDEITDRYEELRGVIGRLKSKTELEKSELLSELDAIAKERDLALEENEAQAEKAMKALFAEKVPAHITETWGELARESLNTATAVGYLTGFGLAAAAIRPAAYTAISGVERIGTVRQEMRNNNESGAGRFAKKYIVDGFTQTMANAVGRGEGEGKLRKGLDAAQAWATIGRTIGLGTEATGATLGLSYEALKLLQENGPSSAQIDTLLDAALTGENIDYDAVVKEIPEVSAISATDTVVETPNGSTVFDAAEPSVETRLEITKEMVETGEVQKNDTIVGIFARQIEANATDFGYEGALNDKQAIEAWSAKHALEVARGTGIIDGDRDLRLSTEAMNDVSLILTPDHGIKFIDVSGNEVDPDSVTYWGYSGGAMQSAGETNMLIRSPREGLLLEAFESQPDAASAAELAPGIEVTTLTSDAGLEKQFTMEDHGSVTFNYDDEGRVTSMKLAIKPPRELFDSVYGAVSSVDALEADRGQYVDGVASQLYVLGEYERAGMQDSEEYRAVKQSLRSFIEKNHEAIQIDVNNTIFKDYLEGLDLERVVGVVLPKASEIVAQTQEQDLRASAAAQEQIAPRAMQVEGRLDMIRLNGNRGDVGFTFGVNGEITGVDYSQVKFGIFARASTVDLVEESSYVPESRQNEYINPRGQIRAKTEIARKIYALRVTEEALENAGVGINDPRREYVHDLALSEISAFNDRWTGIQKVDIGSHKFRTLGI